MLYEVSTSYYNDDAQITGYSARHCSSAHQFEFTRCYPIQKYRSLLSSWHSIYTFISYLTSD
jgi:hypothetical protein